MDLSEIKDQREIYIKNKYPELYKEIISYNKKYFKDHFEDFSWSQKKYNFVHKINKIPICNNVKCNNFVKYQKSNNKYAIYCSNKCAQNDSSIKEKKIKTTLKNFNVKYPSQSKIIKDKIKSTLKQNYNVDNPSQSEIIQNKKIKTNILKYGVNNYSKTIEFKNKLIHHKLKHYSKLLNINITDIEIINNDEFLIKNYCNIHKEFIINKHTIHNRLKLNLTNLCTKCNPISIQSSIKENEIKIYIKTLNIPFIENDKSILDGKELDIYIPSKNLGIEFDGLYWHSNIYKDKNYHLNKTNLAQSKGVQLIHIFEDEWIYKSEIVKSIINSKLGIFNDRIYARKTIIKEINDNNLIRTFLNENHIQGFIGSKVKIGLFYNDELVSLMTFGSLRRSMGQKDIKENHYEMLRFATKLNTQIIGGASKLLNYFIKNYHPKEMITYADRRYSYGDLYKKLGFKFIKYTEPNYWYIKKNQIKREYRFKYRKDILIKEGFDKNKTEKDIMSENGYYHIYDCGNIKFSFYKYL